MQKAGEIPTRLSTREELRMARPGHQSRYRRADGLWPTTMLGCKGGGQAIVGPDQGG